MILETIRIVTDALASSSSYGVNTQIAAVDLDSGDSAPPDVATFVDETRSDAVAVNRITGSTKPVVAVTVGDNTVLVADPMSDVREGTVTIEVSLIYDNADTAEAKQDFLYTMRAIQRAVRQLMHNDNASARTRNDIHVQSLTGMTIGDVFAPIEDGNVAGTITLEFLVRDVSV